MIPALFKVSPASTVKLPALAMVPWLRNWLAAVNDRLKPLTIEDKSSCSPGIPVEGMIEVINPPGVLKMLLAVNCPVVTRGLVE